MEKETGIDHKTFAAARKSTGENSPVEKRRSPASLPKSNNVALIVFALPLDDRRTGTST
jgi:hypothetical protein